jgi:hypothetical protein
MNKAWKEAAASGEARLLGELDREVGRLLVPEIRFTSKVSDQLDRNIPLTPSQKTTIRTIVREIAAGNRPERR